MEPKKLGFGLMRLPALDSKNAAGVDIERLKQMVDLFMSKGFTCFDLMKKVSEHFDPWA